MDFYIGEGRPCRVVCPETEPEAVRIAAANLERDLEKVFGGSILAKEGGCEIRIRTLSGEEIASMPKEGYRHAVQDGALLITGADRRGTIYGIYELSEQLGVSPWYFWADVPVRQRTEFILEDGYEKSDHPSVEYRGIFINDEEELEAWVKKHMGEDTIGVKTYEKVFELLLRLKANYIWPAMHVNSFNVKKENGALAERMGIVVGTSHCDMLMRSNNREWLPWLAKKGYEGVEYDYSIPGRNREILQEYWRESVEQNRDFEVSYTLGMRGIHDSGFETRMLDGLTGEKLKEAKIALLQQVMEDQRDILQDTLGKLPLMTFVPYKEVLPLYDGGLRVPEDVTLVWSNDNYGYVRRYTSEQEKQRRGGNGLYYHNSYWAPPGMSYVFLCSIPLAHTANEMKKAYAEGIRRLWVINTGAMKPLEQEITFFLRLAWEIGKDNASTDDVDVFVADWIDRSFSGGIGKRTAALLNDFSQLTNVRKLEMMDQFAFSQTAYGDEAVTRIHEYERLFEEGNRIYGELPEKERPAFFELVLMRLHAAYFTNLAFYYGDRSTLAQAQGKLQAASFYAGQTRKLEDARRRMLVYYNKVMLDGKWDGILNPEGFPPPRAAMMPVCTPPLALPDGKPALKVTLWNNGDELSFCGCATKWLEIGNAGGGSLEFSIQAPDWAELSCTAGETQTEQRVLVTVREQPQDKSDVILVTAAASGEKAEIPVRAYAAAQTEERGLPREEDGLVWVRADSVPAADGFRLIPRLGRGGGALLQVDGRGAESGCGIAQVAGGAEAPEGSVTVNTAAQKYRIRVASAGQFLLELHRFPSLDSVGRIRIGVSVDGGEIMVLESESRDEHLGSWRENVRNNIDRLYLTLPALGAGVHEIAFYGIDKYFAFSGFAVYTQKRRDNNLAGVAFTGGQALPALFDTDTFAKRFYGEIELQPRPIEFARVEREHDTLGAEDIVVWEPWWAETVAPSYYLALGGKPFAEQGDRGIRIDAAAVLAGRPCAFAVGKDWHYCGSESFGRSGLAMYRPAPSTGEGIADMADVGALQGGQPAADGEESSLHYRIQADGGDYTCWLYTKFNMREEAFFGIAVDGEELAAEALYNGGCLWRYEAEQIYRWVPVAAFSLETGEHELTVLSRAAGLRIDRIYLTRGTELAPTDCGWML